MLVKITADKMVETLKDFDLKSFASIKAVTKPLAKASKKTQAAVMAATGSHPDNIRKFASIVIGLGYDYDKLVGNRRIKEDKTPEFDKGASWHVPYEGSTTIRTNPNNLDEKYMYVACIANNKPKTSYFDVVKGVAIDENVIAPYLPNKSIPTNQGLENPIIVRTYKMENIKELTIGGNTFQID